MSSNSNAKSVADKTVHRQELSKSCSSMKKTEFVSKFNKSPSSTGAAKRTSSTLSPPDNLHVNKNQIQKWK